MNTAIDSPPTPIVPGRRPTNWRKRPTTSCSPCCVSCVRRTGRRPPSVPLGRYATWSLTWRAPRRGMRHCRSCSARRFRAARHKGDFQGNSLDAMNERPADRSQAGRTGEQLSEMLIELALWAIRGRRRRARWWVLPLSPSTPRAPRHGFPARVSMGHLCAVVLTRDVWMHKFDIGRALRTEVPMDDSDTRLVADVAAEWQHQHGQPVRLGLRVPPGAAGAGVRGTRSASTPSTSVAW